MTCSDQEFRFQRFSGAKVSLLLFILNLFALCFVGYIAVHKLRKPLQFDDAFMFERYALHVREGMGISWNLDKIHTGGMTSLGWFLVVLPVSFLPVREGQPLAIASFVVGLVGIFVLAWQISKLSSSSVLRRFWLVFPTLTLLLTGTKIFRLNMVTGMDTMLSFAFDAALSVSIWVWCKQKNSSKVQPMLIGLLGACAVVSRPENGLLAVLAPLLAALLLLDRSRRAKIIWLAFTFAISMTVYGIFYHAYFHAWLPLSFYMKSQHPYRGYVGAVNWAPEKYLARFMLFAIPVLAFALMCLDRRTFRIAVTYLVPLALTFAYLQNVMQIMGSDARYYVPFTAPVLVAACWMSDVTLGGDWRRLLWRRLRMIAFGCPVLLLLVAISWRPMMKWSKDRLRVESYPEAKLIIPAASSLPERSWFQTVNILANQIIKPLPTGTVVAASEVGLIGAAAPQVSVIDLAGLNDNDIALHGFNMDRLLDRKPLLIWFPHSDYTWQRQAMLCSPRLIKTYVVIGGNAFNYSLAIRRDMPETDQIMQRVSHAFSQTYPGDEMRDFIVSVIKCDPS